MAARPHRCLRTVGAGGCQCAGDGYAGQSADSRDVAGAGCAIREFQHWDRGNQCQRCRAVRWVAVATAHYHRCNRWRRHGGGRGRFRPRGRQWVRHGPAPAGDQRAADRARRSDRQRHRAGAAAERWQWRDDQRQSGAQFGALPAGQCDGGGGAVGDQCRRTEPARRPRAEPRGDQCAVGAECRGARA